MKSTGLWRKCIILIVISASNGTFGQSLTPQHEIVSPNENFQPMLKIKVEDTQKIEHSGEDLGFLTGRYEVKTSPKSFRKVQKGQRDIKDSKDPTNAAQGLVVGGQVGLIPSDGRSITGTNGSKNTKAKSLNSKSGSGLDWLRSLEPKTRKPAGIENPNSVSTTLVERSPESNGSDSENLNEPSLKEQIKSIFSSTNLEINKFYSEHLDPEDSRVNHIELDLRATSVEINSRSNFSFRNYGSQFSGIDLAASIWFNPGVSLYGRIFSSIGADISNTSQINSHSPARFEDVAIGFRFRKFMGLLMTSPSVEIDALLLDERVNVAGDDQERLRLKSSGLELDLQVKVPQSNLWSLGYGFLYAPKLSHSEDNTGVKATSGSPTDSTKIGVKILNELRMSRGEQVLLDFGLSVERNLFGAEATGIDPQSGVRPTNVSVSNTKTTISFGYRWGK